MSQQILLWGVFTVGFVGLLLLDLCLFHRKSHAIKIKEALLATAFWISLALLFNAGVYFWRGYDAALKFLTGYILEYSLSVDNLFVFLLIFRYFAVPHQDQHKVLFWGILSAQIMRALFILTGVSLIHRFHWVLYLFGIFLVLTGAKLAFQKEKEVRPDKNPVVRLFKKFMPVTPHYEGNRFFVRHAGRLSATPLLIVLLVIETTDVLFAVDSIPAILGITTDPFIVYTSNMFAILGLRSLYFALAGLMQLFRYLNYGLAAILVFIGVKMLVADFVKIPVGFALGVIGGILAMSVIASLLKFKMGQEPPEKADKPKL